MYSDRRAVTASSCERLCKVQSIEATTNEHCQINILTLPYVNTTFLVFKCTEDLVLADRDLTQRSSASQHLNGLHSQDNQSYRLPVIYHKVNSSHSRVVTSSSRHSLNRKKHTWAYWVLQPAHIVITAGCLVAESLVALVQCTNYYYPPFAR